MTTYPAIIPSSRTFTPGLYPHTPFQALSGKQSRVRHSSVMVSSRVSLRYSVLAEAEMIEILDHYNLVKGGVIPFALPVIAWSGNENANDFVLPGDAWRYLDWPEVEEVFTGPGTDLSGCIGYVVQVELESVPGEGVGLLGPAFRVRAVFTPGGAAAANGPAFVIKTTLDFGRGIAPGFSESVDVVFTPGTATGGTGVTVEGGAFGAGVRFRPGRALDELARLFTIKTRLLAGSSLARSSITYSQSGVYPSTTPADNAIMTDGSFNNTGAATTAASLPWIKMDLGASFQITEVVVGTATNNIPGGWDKSYTENKDVEYSTDDTNWTVGFNTGTLATDGIYTFSVNFTARYIRIKNFTTSQLGVYVAVSEFYANAVPGPPAFGAANAPGFAGVASVTFNPGTASGA